MAHEVMRDAVARIRDAKGVSRVVVIVDDFEKFQPLRTDVDGERESMEAAVESLFTQHAAWLKLPCHTIYTFPLWLRHRVPNLGSTFDGTPRALPMVKVFERDGGPSTEGRAKLKLLLQKRLDLPAALGADWAALADNLIEASGGYPRDLLRMIRDLLVMRVSKGFPAEPADVAHVQNLLREDYALVLAGEDIPLLAGIATSNTLDASSPERRMAMSRLLDRWLVLAYRNGEAWYDVPPLVRTIPAVRSAIEHAKQSVAGAGPSGSAP